MPTDNEKKKIQEFAERLKAGMAYKGYVERGRDGKSFSAFAVKYGVKAPVVSEWRKADYMPEHSKARLMAQEFECDDDWFYYGEGEPPVWFGGTAAAVKEPRQPYGPAPTRRYADGDVIALQIGIESLAALVLQSAPRSARAFLDDMAERIRKHKFGDPENQGGLLLQLQRIAREAPARAAKAARQARQRGSAPSKKR